jgi:plastocyanin
LTTPKNPALSGQRHSAVNLGILMRALAAFAAAIAAALFMTLTAHAAGFSDIVLATDKDATETETTFAPDTAEIFLTAQMEDVKPGSKVTIIWVSVDSHGVAPANYKIDTVDLDVGDGMNVLDGNITKPTAGWPVGTYRVDLALDGTVLSSADFEIK